MSDDLSPLDRRMFWPGVFALGVGLGLAGLAVITARQGGTGPTWAAGLPAGLLAAVALYAVMYRNLSRRVASEGE
ncbi:hypothetical protein ACFQL1_05695 [Halomicroarcula sp. GCM10025709]|uniref:hypothetical protein n=1 Tax=Haloarcula TaxID=2237 RepID=UPI0024C3FE0E|nr:hypothetical protein [Halomicroarcula sp. YJ-61-S]